MHIYFERTGGFAGMSRSISLDEEDLNEEDREAIRSALDRAGFFELPPRIESESSADRFSYRIDVNWHGRENIVEVSESAAPEELCPLIEFLEKLLRTRQRPS